MKDLFLSTAFLLRATREKLGLTQAEVGRRMGTTSRTVDQLETGARTLTLELLQRFAGAMDCRAAFTLERESVLSSGDIGQVRFQLHRPNAHANEPAQGCIVDGQLASPS